MPLYTGKMEPLKLISLNRNVRSSVCTMISGRGGDEAIRRFPYASPLNYTYNN
jgi:hypothetical protein